MSGTGELGRAPGSDVGSQPILSVVVVAYDMARELPRTLTTLDRPYQRGLRRDQYEIVVVDNGSNPPVEPALIDGCTVAARLARIDDASPSPASAANLGIERARGELIGLVVDGARMASPGLLAMALRARALSARPVIATLGWHLGPVRHMEATEAGIDPEEEDRLLEQVGWLDDGYRLFSIATIAGSSARGWFGPLGESSALFMTRELWSELGGLDERFTLPGGGLVNHDLYRRACELPDIDLVVLLGEGTFHQQHGGAATGRTITWDAMQADYECLRGTRYKPPRQRPLYLGRVPATALEHVAYSARMALEKRERRSRSSSRPN